MATRSMLDEFLTEILKSLRARNGHQITDLIQLDIEHIDPSRQKPYSDLNRELNTRYPHGNNAELAKHCKNFLPSDELGSFHSSFSDSMIQYFRYLRDFTTADHQAKATEIRQLTSQCITALGDSRYGVIMIPIVLSFSRVLAKIASNLDRNPNLSRQTASATPIAEESGGSKVSFVESTANVLRDAFIKCLAGSPGSSRSSRPAPDDKRYGIYLTANSCLKLLWQCRKLRNAQQMFLSIDAQSPPLSFYPAAQRVTYLYYLGRYHFANNHFYRAQLALQTAYDQCHREALKHKRTILIYLMASNICLGRFPSVQLLSRPEASDLDQYFRPLCRIIKSGDLATLDQYLSLSSDNHITHWFLQKRILLQLRDRCEILVWRSLIRKTFVIEGYKGEEKKIPYLRLLFARAAAQWAWKRAKISNHQIQSTAIFSQAYGSTAPGFKQPGQLAHVDSDFADMNDAINETGFDLSSGTYDDNMVNQSRPGNGVADVTNGEDSPTMYETESVFLSLIQQGLLRGFVVHNPNNPRFAIPGSQAAGGPVLKGFPRVWDVVSAKAMDGDGKMVPGWVKDDILHGGGMKSGSAGLGGVVRLSGARPVGVS